VPVRLDIVLQRDFVHAIRDIKGTKAKYEVPGHVTLWLFNNLLEAYSCIHPATPAFTSVPKHSCSNAVVPSS